jgi:PIN domain nuclease of toxin-antitoxin system
MATKHVVDTHALIWFLEGNPRLGRGAKAVLDDPASELVLPLIALAEAIDLVAKGRTTIPSVSDLLRSVSTDARIDRPSLTWDVLLHSLALSVLPDIHDRLIVAEVLHLQAQGYTADLLTRDAAISGAGVVPVVW